jgi:hypothetical protein
MATKTAKSQGLKKAVETSTGQEIALTSSPIHLGPPYSGFSKEISYPSDGYWNAVKIYPLSGQIVVQLGAVQQILEGIGSQEGGFMKTFSVGSPGIYVFSLVTTINSLTLLPKSRDTVAAGAFIYLAVNQSDSPADGAHTGWQIDTDWRHPIRNAYYPMINLVVSATLAANVTYKLHAGVGVGLEWTGNLFNAPPYAEIIATLQSLTQSGPGATVLTAVKKGAKAGKPRYFYEEYTDEEASKM